MKIGDTYSAEIQKHTQDGYFHIVCFWSKSCPACTANMPNLKNLLNNFSEKVKIIYIHRPMHTGDLDEDKVLKYGVEMNIENHMFDNDHSIGDKMGVTGWPTYFLFDDEGKLRRYAPGDLGVRVIEQVLIRIFGDQASFLVQ